MAMQDTECHRQETIGLSARYSVMTDASAFTCRNYIGAIRVAAPRVGDVLSGALHKAYDQKDAIPVDLAVLVAELDRVDRRPL